jgi:hypothetical protein
MADRYLYFVLAGLLGAVLVHFAPRLRADHARLELREFRLPLGIVGGAAIALGRSVGFAVHAHQRAAVWSSPEALENDSAVNYPDGVTGNIVKARRAIAIGDGEAAVDAIEAAVRLGHDNALSYMSDPTLQPLRGYPRFEALLQDMARRWIVQWETIPNKAPGFGVVDLVIYHLLLGEPERARERLAVAEAGGPSAISPEMAKQLREQIDQVEAALAAEALAPEATP